jgi:hypothetical protein
MPIRNRIKAHRRVRAGDLVPHEFNFRMHPDRQRAALAALYRDVGFARSLLAFELPDGRLKLIDGHLRRDVDPDMEVEVEVLDVSEEEARTLLLSIDPLAALAQEQEQLRQRLEEIAPPPPDDLRAAWEEVACAALAQPPPAQPARPPNLDVSAQFLVLVTCRDEAEQVELLGRFQSEGIECRALLA